MWITVLAVVGLVTALAVPALPAVAAGVFTVRDYGATGNGSSNDTPAINKAIVAANAAGGGTVEFTSGCPTSASPARARSTAAAS